MRLAILMADNEYPYCALGNYKHSGDVVLTFWRYSLNFSPSYLRFKTCFQRKHMVPFPKKQISSWVQQQRS